MPMNHKTGEYTLPIGHELRGGQHTYKVVEVLGQGGYGITYKVSAEIKMGNIPIKYYLKELRAQA